MNMIKLKILGGLPEEYTGLVEWEDGDKGWYKNGNLHKEEGPARIHKDGYKSWWLDGNCIWSSYNKLYLTNQIILSKIKRPEYPTVQAWKILGPNGLREQIIIPGMEEFIKE